MMMVIMIYIQNKKLTNVAEGINQSHILTKHQIETGLNMKIDKSEISSVNPEANKLVKYLLDKGLLTEKMHISDEFSDTVVIKSEEQDFDNVHLNIL